MIRVNSNVRIRRESVSPTQHCIVADNFLAGPHELVDYATDRAERFSTYASGYPGLQFHVDDGVLTDVFRFIRAEMPKEFPFFKGNMKQWALLSMVTLRPDELSLRQRICHTDPMPAAGRTVYAALVYLFENERLGGTSFYRWKNRSLLRRTAEAERSGRISVELEAELPMLRKPPCYMTETNEIAELVRTFPARFNRFIFYWGGVPHSGAISAPELLSPDTRKGRLTLNCFANVVPIQPRPAR